MGVGAIEGSGAFFSLIVYFFDPRRRFVAADLVGCGLWAALYTAAGALGGRLSGHPVLAVTAAVVLAVVASTVVGGLVRRRQQRADEAAQTSCSS